MVIGGCEPMTAADRILADRMAAELKRLLYGRTVEEAVTLLVTINEGMAAKRAEQQAAAVEMITVH